MIEKRGGSPQGEESAREKGEVRAIERKDPLGETGNQ